MLSQFKYFLHVELLELYSLVPQRRFKSEALFPMMTPLRTSNRIPLQERSINKAGPPRGQRTSCYSAIFAIPRTLLRILVLCKGVSTCIVWLMNNVLWTNLAPVTLGYFYRLLVLSICRVSWFYSHNVESAFANLQRKNMHLGVLLLLCLNSCLEKNSTLNRVNDNEKDIF